MTQSKLPKFDAEAALAMAIGSDSLPPAKPSLLAARDAVAMELYGKRYADLPRMFAQMNVDAEVARRLAPKTPREEAP